jgi:hypothetical protein
LKDGAEETLCIMPGPVTDVLVHAQCQWDGRNCQNSLRDARRLNR